MMTKIGKILLAAAMMVTLAAAVLVWAGPNRLPTVEVEPLQCVTAGSVLVCFDADPRAVPGCEVLDDFTVLCRGL
jgi:hypothetical protein